MSDQPNLIAAIEPSAVKETGGHGEHKAEHLTSQYPQTYTQQALAGVNKLNQLRVARGLKPVALSIGLSARCQAWAQQMANGTGLNHDRSVYGTQEREDIAWDGNNNITIDSAFDMWVNSGGHAAAMFDQGWPEAYKAGYGSAGGYASLRLCPGGDQGQVCCE